MAMLEIDRGGLLSVAASLFLPSLAPLFSQQTLWDRSGTATRPGG